MRIPRKLYIGGYVVPVKYGKKVIVDGEECFGYYNPNAKEIILAKGMNPQRKREIFFHEFMHLVEDIYRMKLKHEYIANMSLALSQLFANHKVDLK